jgi:hypothetical protein
MTTTTRRPIYSHPKQKCAHPKCEREYDTRCECCREETRFCDEHGSLGGDRETGYGLMAYPSACWKCGGYNVDEE